MPILNVFTILELAKLSYAARSDDPRVGNQGWLIFKDLFQNIQQAACAINQSGENQICAINLVGELKHAIRDPGDNWTPFGDVQTETNKIGPNPGIGPLVQVACATTLGDELHVCALDRRAKLWHTIRSANGVWPFPFGDVQAETRKVGPNPGIGPISHVACAAGSITNELHVCAVDMQGKLWHTVRRSDGVWPDAFADIQAETGKAGPNPAIGPTRRVACALDESGELHVCALDQNGRLWHTIRRADRSWPFQFANVGTETAIAGPNPTAPFGEIACAVHRGPNANLHLCATTAVRGQRTDGQVWHTTRRVNGTWSKFTNVFETVNVLAAALNVSVSHD